MSECASLLIEIGTEELPPDSLPELGEAFACGIAEELRQLGFCNQPGQAFYTPRRLAVLLPATLDKLSSRQVIRKGPPLSQACDSEGNYTKAAIGFAKSCGIDVAKLQKSESEQRVWCEVMETGASLADVLSDLLERVALTLPIRRKMRWQDKAYEFVRPVRWLCVLYGTQVLKCQLFGVTATNQTKLHRSCHPQTVAIQSTEHYEQTLADGKVIADFSKRRAIIAEGMCALTRHEIIADDSSLDRAASLVEWPQVIKAVFDKRFLELPEEVVIHTLKYALGAFAVRDISGALLPEFFVVVNVESVDVGAVTAGYERVVVPRLADADFFFKRDRTITLAERCQALDGIVFQKQLGTLADKVVRLEKLGPEIVEICQVDNAALSRAARLCKCDLTTDMVLECPELQGIMGKHYARADGESDIVATAIEEHYRPRYGSDNLPVSPTGIALALLDKMDTLTGIFSIGRAPTSNKDPFALRRAALGIIRILVEGKVPLNLKLFIRASLSLHQATDYAQCENEVLMFFQERLRGYYLEQGYAADCINAVMAVWLGDPLDCGRRLEAITSFRTLPEAEDLTLLSKRIRNILKKASSTTEFNVEGFTEPSEQDLWEAVSRCDDAMAGLLAQSSYLETMRELANLRAPADRFFDDVMVISEHKEERDRRLGLLDYLNRLFMQVADFSKLNVSSLSAGQSVQQQ